VPAASLICRAAIAVGDVANYCDHSEHCEEVRREWVTESARDLRVLAFTVAQLAGFDLAGVLGAPTWRSLQLALVACQRHEQPDLVGRSRYEQLRVHAINGTILVSSLTEGCTAELAWKFLALGVGLSTVMFEKLPEEPVG
jgi:hypothetical protein